MKYVTSRLQWLQQVRVWLGFNCLVTKDRVVVTRELRVRSLSHHGFFFQIHLSNHSSDTTNYGNETSSFIWWTHWLVSVRSQTGAHIPVPTRHPSSVKRRHEREAEHSYVYHHLCQGWANSGPLRVFCGPPRQKNPPWTEISFPCAPEKFFLLEDQQE
jgi:hypothetical protein